MAPSVIWTKEECEKLNHYVKIHGKKWTPIASLIGSGKNGKQCRRQWERLNMSTRQGSWTREEDTQLLELHGIHGNKWTFISRTIGGRTDNAVKNRYHALQNKKKSDLFEKMEVEPKSSNSDETTSSDSTSNNRILKHFTSLERVRASRELRRQQMCIQNDELQFANDSSTLNNYPDSSILTQTDASSPIFSSTMPLGSWAEPWRAALQSMYTSNRGGWNPVIQDLDCVLTPDRCSEDLDSWDSSSMETKQSPASNGCFMQNEETGIFSNLIGGESSSTLLFGSRSTGSCDFDICEIKNSITRDTRNFKSRGLSIDLNFSTLTSGFDLDDFSQKFSPSSPSAFLKPLSPPIV